ncbi:hypothetical protein EYF80_044776 [Liparis tanakae]|uniref:Uncharacterized protein n=1 Tax=Liparis tanakae TaxID=230148 RepID=A0A4Z2FV29_9TELE|nr:hypothetical protein EYF80_044776 [Liparis tanakae]
MAAGDGHKRKDTGKQKDDARSNRVPAPGRDTCCLMVVLMTRLLLRGVQGGRLRLRLDDFAPFRPDRTLASDTGLALPLERSDLIMLACPPSLFPSFLISYGERGRRGG